MGRLPRPVLLLIAVTLVLDDPTRGDPPPPPRPRSDAHGDPLPPGALARLGTVRFRHGGAVRGLAFSPDGKLLASAGEHGSLRLWDWATGKEVRRLRDAGKPFLAVAFSPDGKTLVTADEVGIIRFWETATGKQRYASAFLPGLRRVRWLTFSPGGKLVACWIEMFNETHGVVVLSAATGTELHRLSGEGYREAGLAFTPDGKSLVTAGSDGRVRVWDVRTWKESSRFKAGGGGVTGLALSADGKTLVAGCMDGRVRRVDLRAGKTAGPFRVDRPGYPPEHLALSPDGKVVASAASHAREVVLWETATGKELHRLGGQPPVEAMAFSPDGRVVASGGYLDGTIRLYDPATGKRIRRPPAPDWQRQVCYSPDGRVLATVGDFDGVQLWDPATGKETARLAGDAGPITRVCFSPDGKTLATGDARGVRLWTVPGGKELRSLRKDLGGLVSSLAFSPDGRALGAAGGPHLATLLHLWEVATGKQLPEVAGPGHPPAPRNPDWAEEVLFAPDGRTVATRHASAVTLREVATGKVRCYYRQNLAELKAIAFAPDGKTLASAESNGVVRLWDVYTGKERLRIEVPQVAHVAVAISPDGKLLASAGEEDAVRLWDVRTGREVHRFLGHRGPGVHGLAFSPDGRTLASVGRDTTVLVWDVAAAVPDRGAGEWDELWKDLAGEDAERAHRAMGRFIDVPDRAVAVLGKRLRPVPAVDARAVARWLRELDDSSFAVREKATAALEAGGEAALPLLEEALKNKPPLEVRRRIEGLLGRLKGPAAAAEWMRALRALEVLERIGDRGAEAVLSRLAGGAPGARLTREARASLRRLQRSGVGMK